MLDVVLVYDVNLLRKHPVTETTCEIGYMSLGGAWRLLVLIGDVRGKAMFCLRY